MRWKHAAVSFCAEFSLFSEFECSVGFSSVLFSFWIIVFLLTLREATLYLSVWENDPVMTQFRTFWTLSRPKLDSTVRCNLHSGSLLPCHLQIGHNWFILSLTFHALTMMSCTEASHIFKDPKLHKKGSQIFFLTFHNSFYLKGWNNRSGQERRELIHVFLSPFIVSVTFGRKPSSWAGAIVEADDEESIKHSLFFSYIKHQLNCLPFQQT